MAVAAQHRSGSNRNQRHVGTQSQSALRTPGKQAVPAPNHQLQQWPAQQDRDNHHDGSSQVAVEKSVHGPGTLQQIEACFGVDDDLRKAKCKNTEVPGRDNLACNGQAEVQGSYGHGWSTLGQVLVGSGKDHPTDTVDNPSALASSTSVRTALNASNASSEEM